jgi:hypothetical protein
MKRKFALLFLLSFLYPVTLSGQIVNSDSVINTSSDSDQVFLPVSQFKYADDRKYTISGDQPRLNTEIKPITTAILGGVTLATMVAMHIH